MKPNNFDWVQNGTHAMVDLWMYNFARNINDFLDGESSKLLSQFNNNKPDQKYESKNSAIVIGGGPSVKENNQLEVLANSNYQGSIVCTDRMLVRCLENGVTPEKFPKFYVLTIDPYEITLKFYKDKIIEKYSNGISAVMSTCTMHETIELCKQHGLNIFWFHPLIDDYRKTESISKIMNMMSKSDKNPKGFPGLQTGGNVGSFSWIFSWAILGCSPVSLIGLNMGVDVDTPLEQTQHYSQVLNHFDGDKTKVHEKYRNIFNPDIETETILDPVFDFYREALLDLVKRSPQWVKTINSTEGGSLFGERIQNLKFLEFLESNKK